MSNTGYGDGEVFLDTPRDPIPSAHTWEDLTVNQLLAAQAQLSKKLWAFQSNPAYAKPLREGLAKLEAIIAAKSSAAF